MYISQILNFKQEHSNMPIYKTLEKSWILNILRKESIFLYLKIFFFRGIAVFTSLGVAIFRVILRDCAQIFLKNTTIYEKDDSICFHFLYMDQMWRVKRMWHEKISLILCEVCCSASNIKKLTTWKRTNWQVISTLPPLIIPS